MFEGTIPAADAKPVCHAGDVETMKGIIEKPERWHTRSSAPRFLRHVNGCNVSTEISASPEKNRYRTLRHRTLLRRYQTHHMKHHGRGIIDDTLLTHSDNNGKPTFKRRLQSPIHPHVPRKPYGRFRNAGEPTAPQGTPVEIGDSPTLRTCWLTPS